MMNLPDLFSAQFDYAFKFQRSSNIIKVSAFLFNILLILLSLYNQAFLEKIFIVALILIISITSLYFDYGFIKKSIQEHEKGEKLRKIHLIDFIFKSKIEDSELEYLLLDIAKSVKDQANTNKRNTDSSTNFSNNETEQKSKIVSYIQQNCFETSQYLMFYYKELNRVLKRTLIIGSIIVFLICVYFISSGFSSFSVTQLIIASFNFLFALNIFEYISRYEKKAQQLKVLDKTLQLIKSDAEFSEIIYYFSEYNSILVDKPLYPERIYSDNCKEVESRWVRRA